MADAIIVCVSVTGKQKQICRWDWKFRILNMYQVKSVTTWNNRRFCPQELPEINGYYEEESNLLF